MSFFLLKKLCCVFCYYNWRIIRYVCKILLKNWDLNVVVGIDFGNKRFMVYVYIVYLNNNIYDKILF